MNRVLLFVITGLLFTSCITARKYSTIVDTKIKEQVREVEPWDWLVINPPEVESEGNQCKQEKYYFIPAILYWGFNTTIECEIDQNTRISYIKEGIYKAADSLNLKGILNGKQVEIDLKQLPGKFLYENWGSAIFLMVAYTYSGAEKIDPVPLDLMFEYRLKENEAVITSGNSGVYNYEKPLGNIWKSTKKFTWLYLAEFKKETDRMGVELVKELIEQIEKDS